MAMQLFALHGIHHSETNRINRQIFFENLPPKAQSDHIALWNVLSIFRPLGSYSDNFFLARQAKRELFILLWDVIKIIVLLFFLLHRHQLKLILLFRSSG